MLRKLVFVHTSIAYVEKFDTPPLALGESAPLFLNKTVEYLPIRGHQQIE